MTNVRDWPWLDRRRVKAARITRGYDSGDEIAEALGVRRSRYYAWEVGRNRIPPESLRALAKLLGVAQRTLVAK